MKEKKRKKNKSIRSWKTNELTLNAHLLTAKSNVLHPPEFVPQQLQVVLQNGVMPSHVHATQKESHMYKHRLSIY